MKIIVDARPFIHPLTGVGTFLQSFLKSLQKNASAEIYVLVPQKIHDSVDIMFGQNVHVVVCPLLGMESIPRFLWFFLKVPIMLWRIKPDLFFSPLTNIPLLFPRKTKTLIVVHDVVNLEFSDTMPWSNRFYNKCVFARAVRKADYLWVNSEYTKRKIELYFPKRIAQDIFVGGAADRDLFRRLDLSIQDVSQIKKKYQIKDKFILFVGSLEPRKNLRFLLGLMPELMKYHIQLLVVGGKGWKNSDLYAMVDSSEDIKCSTVFAGYVSNENLVKLYNMADCYVSTALNEGFGMPQLEALLCGCPVVTAHNSGMVEVVEGRGITVKGWDRQEWVDKILTAIGRGKIYSDLSIYDWDLICDKLLNFYLIEKK
ncbi:glycosyltransferase family 4 protein [Phocaeicola sp.]